MSECVVRMEMPRVCITENGYHGYCPMDRVWCIQRNAPPDITMCEAYEAMTDKIPSWCPIICALPENHGRLVDADVLFDKVYEFYGYDNEDNENWMMGMINDAPAIVPAERRKA